MKRKKRNFSDYAAYFNIMLPNSTVLLFYLIIIGAAAGALSAAVVHYSGPGSVYAVLAYGASAGVIVITVPAILAAILFKVIRRRLKVKHSLFAALIVSVLYAVCIIIDALLYALIKSSILEYVILILANAAVYGYWFIVGKMVVGQRKSAAITSAFHPVINVLFYLPLGSYILDITLPVNQALIKLYGGMAVFLLVGYAAIYLIERPGKKALDTKPVEIFSLMTEQLLYNITKNPNPVLAKGTKRRIRISMLLLRGKKSRSLFVMPDLHYGPFAGVGGGLLPERLGDMICKNHGAVPFIMHGAVNIDDNPLYMHQISEMEKRISEQANSMLRKKTGAAHGSISYGKSGRCKAIDIVINNARLLLLSKAPYVTEDMARGVGRSLEELHELDGKMTMLVDMHNSRFESAPEDELKGVYEGSRYAGLYAEAIKNAISMEKNQGKARFGSSYARLGSILKNKDLGTGYTSAGVFEIGKKRLCIIYFDANNMLPGFRNNVISYVRKNFGMEVDLCTTDTHSVNTIAMSAMNSLGRYTKEREIYPHIHRLVSEAVSRMEDVGSSYGEIFIEDFYTWGEHSFENILKMAKDIGGTVKHVLPFVTVAAFIIAAWVIYAL